MKNMNKKLSIWKSQYFGFRYLMENNIWSRNDHFVGFNNVSQGLIINMLVNAASVVEGSLRSYLLTEIDENFRRIIHLENVLNKPEVYEVFKGTEKYYDVKELLDSEISKMDNFLDNNLVHQEVYRNNASFKLLNFKVSINILRKEPILKVKREKIDKILSKIQNSAWGQLTAYFKAYEGRSLSSILKKVDDDLSGDIKKLFELRNFLVHSNIIELKSNQSNYDYSGKLGPVVRYLKTKKLIKKASQNYTFDQIFTEELVRHYSQVLSRYFDASIFQKFFYEGY